MSTLSLNSSDCKFTETEIQLGLGTGSIFLDNRCISCKKRMYKEIIGLMITPFIIKKELVYVCYRCGKFKRVLK